MTVRKLVSPQDGNSGAKVTGSDNQQIVHLQHQKVNTLLPQIRGVSTSPKPSWNLEEPVLCNTNCNTTYLHNFVFLRTIILYIYADPPFLYLTSVGRRKSRACYGIFCTTFFFAVSTYRAPFQIFKSREEAAR